MPSPSCRIVIETAGRSACARSVRSSVYGMRFFQFMSHHLPLINVTRGFLVVDLVICRFRLLSPAGYFDDAPITILVARQMKSLLITVVARRCSPLSHCFAASISSQLSSVVSVHGTGMARQAVLRAYSDLFTRPLPVAVVIGAWCWPSFVRWPTGSQSHLSRLGAVQHSSHEVAKPARWKFRLPDRDTSVCSSARCLVSFSFAFGTTGPRRSSGPAPVKAEIAASAGAQGGPFLRRD